MKKLLLSLFLVLTVQIPFIGLSQANASSEVDWQVVANWKLDAKPIDLVHSLDNQKVFILGDDHKVHMFTAQGQKLGSVPVDKGVKAIDIAPRGEMIYLINGDDNTFTSLAISFIAQIDITDAPFLGNPDAPVVLAVFSDFQ